MTFTVRDMVTDDIPVCIQIINEIIERGGSTAHEDLFDHKAFFDHYFQEPEVANTVMVGDRVVGFQAAFEVEPGVYSIGSFTSQSTPTPGAGAALMVKTKRDCSRLGGTSIIAKITSDNTGGLAYYSKMGFAPDTIWHADFTRADGTTVDRIVKRFVL